METSTQRGQFREAAALALDTLRRHPLRSFLTMLGMVIGVSTVIGVTSWINALNSSVVASVESLGSNIIICYRFPWATMGRPPSDWLTRKELEAEWAADIAQLPHVEAAAASLRIFRPEFGAGTSYVRRGEVRARNVILQGNPPEIERVLSVGLDRGRWFTRVDMDHRSPVVVLGFETARTLFPREREDPIGREVLIEGQVFTVVGVLERQQQALGGGANPEDNIAILPLSTLRKLFPGQKDHVIFVKADAAENVDRVVDSVRDLLRRKRKLPSSKPDDFAIFTPDLFLDLWSQLSTGLFALMFAVSSVALLVGGVGVMNIMLVSVTERTREIGIRKAIGARRGNILLQFLVEAVTLAGIGGAIGVVMGWLLTTATRAAFSISASLSLFWVLAALAMSASVGVFFGMYPAVKASRLDPVEALRYE